jgi:hypothetical protein
MALQKLYCDILHDMCQLENIISNRFNYLVIQEMLPRQVCGVWIKGCYMVA